MPLVAILLIAGYAVAGNQTIAFSARDINGALVSSKELLGKGPLIVYFWNTCCGLKKNQIEAIKQLHTTYQAKGLQVVAVSEDGAGKASKVCQVARSYEMPFIVIIDNNKEIKEALNAFAEPSLFIIDQNGSVVASYAGYMPGDEKKTTDDVRKLFEGK